MKASALLAPGGTTPPSPPGNALYEVTISHARSAPLRNVFRYRGYLWLVDLDHLPRVAGWPASAPVTTSGTRGPASGPTSTGSWPRAASTWAGAG